MNKLITTLKEIFSIEDLRIRIVNTFLFLAIFRLGSYIVLPGVNANALNATEGSIFGLLDTLLGGAFSKASIFGLGIMPYITASIVLQLLTVALPYFQRLQKEGESGRKKINQYTRTLTVVITAAQALGYISATIPQEAIDPRFFESNTLFYLSSIFTLVAGTMFCMWLGEKITEKGLGNGISMLIMIGIISRFPRAIIMEGASREMKGAIIFSLELVALVFVVMLVVLFTQATRRIPIQYARQMIGSKVYGGQRQYLPIKVITAGVMPIIFAQSLMFLPTLLGQYFRDKEWGNALAAAFNDIYSWQYNLVFAALIIIFTFFYTAIAINPQQISDDMKRNNGFIPGVAPGEETTEYIADVIDRITLPGALFLAVIAIIPSLARMIGMTTEFSQFFGGTSLLIMVGVVLDTLAQIDSYRAMSQYDSLMKTGSFSPQEEGVAAA